MAQDYSKIDEPYDPFLSRERTTYGVETQQEEDSDTDTSGGSSSSIGTPSAGGGAITNPSDVDAKSVSGQLFTDLRIQNWIQSRNYSPKKFGFYIDGRTGYAEFVNVYVSGTIIASSGTIGGFEVGSDYIRDTGNSFGLSSASTGADDVRFWAGDTLANKAIAPFRVTESGVLTATSGTIGGITMAATYLRSTNYSAGLLGKGFSINSDGTAEFQDVTVRGIIRTSVFEKNTVNAIGGNMVVSPADVLSADMSAADSAHLFTTSVTFPVGTVLRMKDGTNDEWLEVTAVSGTDHTVTRDKASAYPANTNPTWKKSTAVVSMAQTGKGVIELDTSSTNSPVMRISVRQSTVYNDLDTKVLVGNLKDKTGVDEYGIWIKAGAAYIAGYRLWEAVVDSSGSTGDYTTIHAAIAAGKKRIFVRAGTYTFPSNLNVTASDVLIEGESRDSVILDTANLYKINNTGDRFTLRNVYFNGRATTGTFIVESTGNDCIFENIRHESADINARGLFIGGTNAIIRNNLFRIEIWPVYSYGNFARIEGNYSDSRQFGDFYCGGQHSIVTRNTVMRTGTGNTGGLFVGGNDVTVSYNYFYSSNPNLTGIFTNVDDTKIIGNYIEGFATSISWSGIKGFVCQGNTIVRPSGKGIAISNATNPGYGFITITGNVVYDPGDVGIYLSAGWRTIVSNNAVYSAGSHGIAIDNFFTSPYAVTITNNLCDSCAGSGFYCRPDSSGTLNHSVIMGNTFSSNSQYGIDCKHDTTIIVGNVSYNNSLGGHNLTSGGSSQVANNVTF